MDEVTMGMKGKNWNGGREVGEEKDSFVDSARFTKWRGTRYTYIYIYIYTKEEKGKSWGVEANDINYSQSPGLKYPKNSRICSWTEAALVGPEYQVPLFKQGILPISPSPSPLTDPSSRSFHSFPLPSFFSFFTLFPPPYRAIWNFYPAYLRARWMETKGEEGEGREEGSSQSLRLFLVRYRREQVEILNERGCFHYIFIVIFIVGWINCVRSIDRYWTRNMFGPIN